MNNLELYERVRSVPKEARKTIAAGRLKGMTDINPMWRIKKLTEEFGVCGFGWYPEIERTWIQEGANGEATANVAIKLYVKIGNEWSKGIPGIGGSSLVAKEKNGLYTDDECYKKAYTDALSVACKALGIGADVYYEKDSTKYEEADVGEKVSQNGETRKKLKELGATDKLLAWAEGKLGKPVEQFTGEEVSELAALIRKKKEESAQAARQAYDEAEGELPF